MTLNELLGKGINLVGIPSKFMDSFNSYVQYTGIEKVTKNDLDKIISHFGLFVFEYNQFADIYKVKAADDSNRVMKEWTTKIGWLTVAIAIMTLVMMITTLCKS